MTAKYTDEQIETMTARYTQADNDTDRKQVIQELSKEFEKSPQSLIAKLAALKVYVKPRPKTKNGQDVTKKEEYVNAIKIIVGAKDSDLDSLHNATKRDLEKLTQCLLNLSDRKEVS